MNNCGISFGNIFKNVASGDTITFHYSLFTLHFSLFTILSPCRGGHWPSAKLPFLGELTLPPGGKVAKIFDFCRMRGNPNPSPTATPSLFTLHYSLFTIHSSLFTIHSSLFTLPPVGAAIGRPPTNCVAICWFSAGKQLVIALRRCDFVKQNHTDEQCSPLRCLTNPPDKGQLADPVTNRAVCRVTNTTRQPVPNCLRALARPTNGNLIIPDSFCNPSQISPEKIRIFYKNNTLQAFFPIV